MEIETSISDRVVRHSPDSHRFGCRVLDPVRTSNHHLTKSSCGFVHRWYANQNKGMLGTAQNSFASAALYCDCDPAPNGHSTSSSKSNIVEDHHQFAPPTPDPTGADIGR